MNNRVKDVRNKLNLSQRQFAKKVGVDPTLICKYESGVRNLPIDTALKFSLILNIDWKDFYPQNNPSTV